jgi:hypothetical protein
MASVAGAAPMSTQLLNALLDKLPPLDMGWSDEMREKWLGIYCALLAERETQICCPLQR